MTKQQTEARQIAERIWDELGDEFNKEDAVALVRDALVIDIERAKDDLARYAVDKVDVARTKPATSRRAQLELPAMDEDRFLALGDGLRVREKTAQTRHIADHLKIVWKNANATMSRAQEEQEFWMELMPYMAQGMTADEALRAYQNDNISGAHVVAD